MNNETTGGHGIDYYTIKTVGEDPRVLPWVQIKIILSHVFTHIHWVDMGVHPYGNEIQYTLNRIIWYVCMHTCIGRTWESAPTGMKYNIH